MPVFVPSTFDLNQEKVFASHQVVRTKHLNVGEEWRTRQPQANTPLKRSRLHQYINKSFHSECQRTKRHPSNLSRWEQESLEIFKKKEKKKGNPEIFSLYNHGFTSEDLHSSVWHLRPSETLGGREGAEQGGQRSWSLQCRERLMSQIPSDRDVNSRGWRWDRRPWSRAVHLTMCWVRDWNSEGGAAAVSAAPARRAAGSGPMLTAC